MIILFWVFTFAPIAKEKKEQILPKRANIEKYLQTCCHSLNSSVRVFTVKDPRTRYDLIRTWSQEWSQLKTRVRIIINYTKKEKFY